MSVQGIGGLFFRAENPEALSIWYRDHLRVGAGCVAENAGAPNEWMWVTQGGPVVFAPFQKDTDYFATDRQFMINFRVSNLDDMLQELRRNGIEVITKPEWDNPSTGRFARIHDPEGNAIELWEPPA
jgi:catechol 2,3-dioxygenase-like lactoylglutathione lyase family enzyme